MEFKFRPIGGIDYDGFEKLKPEDKKELIEKRPDLAIVNNLAAICERIEVWIQKIDEANRRAAQANVQRVSRSFMNEIMKKKN